MTIQDSFKKVFQDKSRLLIVMAHPDDFEIICGGTVARFLDGGGQVRLVVMTNGGKGMQDREDITEEEFSKLRVEEQFKAGAKLGIPEEENFNLGIPDGELETTVDSIEKVVFHIRQFKSDTLITHNPKEGIISFFDKSFWVNHRDHRNTAQVALDAAYPYSRDRGFFPKHFTEQGLGPHHINHVLLADSYPDPRLKYFQVDDYLDARRNALLQHRSAFSGEDVDGLMQEIKTDEGYFEPLAYYEIY